MWPLRSLAYDEPIYRDYLDGIGEDKFRSFRLSVWFEIPFNNVLEAYRKYDANLKAIADK